MYVCMYLYIKKYYVDEWTDELTDTKIIFL